jgi:eukaryotic-like serine/threonine-protein kinase
MATSEGQTAKQFYEFGPFRLDPEKELLLRDNETVPLTPKAFQVLLVLVRSKKELVTKDDLLKAVWPDTFVEETNLSRNVFLLRKALGESPQDHQYIVTVPGRGYRFAEEVQLVPAEELTIVAASHSTVHVQVKETRPWGWIAVGAVALAVVAVISFRQFARRPPALTEKDTIVLADFANSTGDAVFDDTLRQGLAIQLEQSPLLKIMDDEQMRHALRLMSLSSAARVTNSVAHEICVRQGAGAMIDGAITSLGRNYVITLEAIRCQDGATLAREQIQAEDKEHVLNAVATAATDMRAKLGESRDSIQKPNRPPEQATTSSLEALQSYTEGHAEMERSQTLAAIASFERAIALDPSFAMAYYYLGVAYDNIGDVASSQKYAKQAFQLVDRVSDYERAQIVFTYYGATGEVYKEIDALQLSIRSAGNSLTIWASSTSIWGSMTKG